MVHALIISHSTSTRDQYSHTDLDNNERKQCASCRLFLLYNYKKRPEQKATLVFQLHMGHWNGNSLCQSDSLPQRCEASSVDLVRFTWNARLCLFIAFSMSAYDFPFAPPNIWDLTTTPLLRAKFWNKCLCHLTFRICTSIAVKGCGDIIQCKWLHGT